MDDRIFPGVPTINKKIIRKSIQYLLIDKYNLSTRKADIAAWRRLVIILLQKYNKTTSFEKIGKMVGRDHSMVSITNKEFRHLYEGENDFYHYIYMNMKACIDGRPFFTIHDLIEDAAPFFPIFKTDQLEGIKMITERNKSSIRNLVVKIFVLYFQRQGVSRAEIVNFLNLPKETILSGENLVDKKDYFEIINNIINSKIQKLKTDEKRKFINKAS